MRETQPLSCQGLFGHTTIHGRRRANWGADDVAKDVTCHGQGRSIRSITVLRRSSNKRRLFLRCRSRRRSPCVHLHIRGHACDRNARMQKNGATNKQRPRSCLVLPPDPSGPPLSAASLFRPGGVPSVCLPPGGGAGGARSFMHPSSYQPRGSAITTYSYRGGLKKGV